MENSLELRENALELRKNANNLYRAQEYTQAIDQYIKAAEIADNDLKAICFGNIGLCYFNLDEFEQALEFSDKALELNPSYQKVRERKIKILMLQGRVKDAKEEIEKGEVSPDIKKEVEDASAKLFEKEKDEMLGKLKDLGNNILGKFGMSLDNFKMQKTESGGYTINFQNK